MADFASWKQETLAKFATEVNAENEKLREDNKMLLAAWRKAVSEKYLAEALAGSQGPALHPQLQERAPARVAGSQR
jgi:hypothetical protein